MDDNASTEGTADARRPQPRAVHAGAVLAPGATLLPTGRTAVDDTLELPELYAALEDHHREQVLWIARELRRWELGPSRPG